MNDFELINMFEPINYMGFKYRCNKHNFLMDNIEGIKFHAIKEHGLTNLITNNWTYYFTTFGVGDYISPSYRCSFCSWEFLLEDEAKKHLTSKHNIKIEES